jgi:hypothetical protein
MTAMDAVHHAGCNNDTILMSLPHDMLIQLCRHVGLKAALASLIHTSKLHKAWQAAVETVRVCVSDLELDDIAILRKYVNLTDLHFHGECSRGAPLHRIMASVAPALHRLSLLHIDVGRGGFQVLKSLTGVATLSASLNDLIIIDARHTLTPEDLVALVDLRALTYLELECRTVRGEPQQLRSISDQLRSLNTLELCTQDNSRQHRMEPALLAAFPGSITSLETLDLRFRDGQARAGSSSEQQLVATVSRLTNLQSLSSCYQLNTAAAQRAALGPLKQLTDLYFSSGARHLPDFIMLPELPQLVLFTSSFHTLADPFNHPSLANLDAGMVRVSEEWRGKTAEACKIDRLHIASRALGQAVGDDTELQNFPLLPELASFQCGLRAVAGRYRHLVALLRRQARRMWQLRLVLQEPLVEHLPAELPACIWLRLDLPSNMAHSLRGISLPALQTLLLDMHVGEENAAQRFGGLVVAEDLAWVRGLPQLKTLIYRMYGQSEAEAEVREAVEEVMEGSGVQLRWYGGCS